MALFVTGFNRVKKRRCILALAASLIILAAGVRGQEATEEERLFAYCDRLYQLDDSKIYSLAREEFQGFLNSYPDSSATAEAQYKIGNLYAKQGEYLLAIASHMKILYLYPESEWMEKAKTDIKNLAVRSGKDKDLRTKITIEVILKTEPLSGRHFKYIDHLYRLEAPPLYSFTCREFQEFLTRYPQAEDTSQAQLELAHLVKREKLFHQAVAHYLKVIYLYPQAPFLDGVYYQIGDLYRLEIKNYERALETYQQVVDKYPGSEWRKNSLWYSAQLSQDKTKEHGRAIRNYLLLAQDYPESGRAQESLYYAARLYCEKSQDYQMSIQTYHRLVNRYPASRYADYALWDVAKIYEDKLEDFPRAIEAYLDLADKYPESKAAPESLYRAGRIYEKGLKSNIQAMEIYEKLSKKYPESAHGKKATRRLKKLK